MTPSTLGALLTTAARRWPERTAVRDSERSMSYAELDREASRIAAALVRWGIGPGHRVGLHAGKSARTLAGLYGVLRAGAAYVPADPAGPTLRTAAILGDAAVSAIIVDSERLAQWTAAGAPAIPAERLIVLDGEPDAAPVPQTLGAADLAVTEPLPDEPRAISDDPAYVLYTSGSTGTPKGVTLTHRNALGFIAWAVEHYGVGHEDVLSSVAPLHFDLSTFDLFGAALAGAAVVLVDRTSLAFPVSFRRCLESAGVTVCYAVPSLLTMLALRGGITAGSLPALRQLLFAGEVFPTPHLRGLMRQLPHVSFANLYGPTETNVCTFYDLGNTPPEGDAPVPIGDAIADVELLIVADDGTPAHDGEVGELLVRGPTVMAGYFGDPDRTSRMLVPHPWRSDTPDLCYRTGDLVRRRADGALDFLGRRDNQIKSRGYRIELGEVEAALHTYPAAAEAVVVAIPDDLVGNRLIAVVVGTGVDSQDLLRHCAGRIPSYMVPDEVLLLDALPKTSTGKVDRHALTTLCETGGPQA